MLYLDSANIEELRPWVHQLSLDGITCNPKLLAQAGIKADDFIGQARAWGSLRRWAPSLPISNASIPSS